MRPPPMQQKTWVEVKAAIVAGHDAYYIESDGYYDVVVPDALIQCQIPSPATFDALEPEMAFFYNRKHAVDFEANFKGQLLRSNLSSR